MGGGWNWTNNIIEPQTLKCDFFLFISKITNTLDKRKIFQDCNSSVSSNSAWKRNVINSKTLRKPSIGSIAMSIAGTSSGNRIRTISGSSIKENYQNKT